MPSLQHCQTCSRGILDGEHQTQSGLKWVLSPLGAQGWIYLVLLATWGPRCPRTMPASSPPPGTAGSTRASSPQQEESVRFVNCKP